MLDTPKQMSEGNWRVGVFMDDRASAEQTEKLGAIFSGEMGGPMANLVPLISENLGMEVAPSSTSTRVAATESRSGRPWR